jgi:hypothetical protein
MYRENQMKRWGHSSHPGIFSSNIQNDVSENSFEIHPKSNIQISQDYKSTTIARANSPRIVEPWVKAHRVIYTAQSQQLNSPVPLQQKIVEHHPHLSLSSPTINHIESNDDKEEINNGPFLPRFSPSFSERTQEAEEFPVPFEPSTSGYCTTIVRFNYDQFFDSPIDFQERGRKWCQYQSPLVSFINYEGFKTRRRKDLSEIFINQQDETNLNQAICHGSSHISSSTLLQVDCVSSHILTEFYSGFRLDESVLSAFKNDLVMVALKD